MTVPNSLLSFVKTHGVQAAAKAAGCSESHIRNLIADRKKASPTLAIKLHAGSFGAVPGSDLRPELWRSPDDVPVTEAAE